MRKDFNEWSKIKKQLHYENNIPTFKEGEVWWGSIGVNMGHEMDGKNEEFSRSLLIVRKFNHRIFWAVPLSTQIKKNNFYHIFQFKGRKQAALITHLRLYDTTRITDKMGQLPQQQFKEIKRAIIKQF